jgi:hypothetical protein
MFDCLLKEAAPGSAKSVRQRFSGWRSRSCAAFIGATTLTLLGLSDTAQAQTQPTPTQQRPNIIMIVSDDTGYGDLGPYGGGIGRGMPTPSIDKLAAEGMTFFSFYAQPSCTPGRAAMQTGRIPNRSGMTTVAFQGQGGGLPAAEWTLGLGAEDRRLQDLLHRQMASGRSRLRNAQRAGLRRMKYCGLYHLNAYTYADPTWFPDMAPELRAMFQRVTKGAMSGNAGQPAGRGIQDQRPVCRYAGHQGVGVVGIPFFDGYVEKAAMEYLDRSAKLGRTDLHEHQLHEGAPAEHAGIRTTRTNRSPRASTPTRSSSSTPASAASWTRSASNPRLAGNTLVFYTTDNGAWQDVYPDAGYTPFRGTKGTVREGGNRVPAIAWMPGKIAPNAKNHEIVGGLDLMATFASVGGVRLPTQDRANQPIIFDSFDLSPVLFGTGPSPRKSWFYFTENELSPGAARVGNYKAVFNLRGDNGVATGGLAVDTNLGWKGGEKYVATVPQVFDLWQDPQERYDIFMNNYTERTWTMVTISEAIKEPDENLCAVPAAQIAERELHGPADAFGLREIPECSRSACE